MFEMLYQGFTGAGRFKDLAVIANLGGGDKITLGMSPLIYFWTSLKLNTGLRIQIWQSLRCIRNKELSQTNCLLLGCYKDVGIS
jgi:hypothetical protein